MTRLLFAHSSPTLALGMQVALEKRGIVVETVCDGYLALVRLQTGMVDVGVIDPQLPTLDGLSVLRKARSSGVTLPLIVVAGHQAPAERITWFDAGTDDLVHTPFDPDEFYVRVRALHQRSQGRNRQSMDCGPLTYDVLSDSFSLDGTLIAFTPKEHAFVKSLISRPGYMTPKDRVFRFVFGSDSVGAGAMDVVACRVRRKLAGSGVMLSTIRGMGYLLKNEGSSVVRAPILLS